MRIEIINPFTNEKTTYNCKLLAQNDKRTTIEVNEKGHGIITFPTAFISYQSR